MSRAVIADLRRRLHQAQARLEWIERARRDAYGDGEAYADDQLAAENDVVLLRAQLRQAEAEETPEATA